MRERVHAVDPSGEPLGGLSRNTLGGVVDAADGVQHPELVARADTTVGATVAGERGQREPGSRKRRIAGSRYVYSSSPESDVRRLCECIQSPEADSPASRRRSGRRT